MAKEPTWTNDDTIKCPVCGNDLGDLWDYDFSTQECVEGECEVCEAPITLCQHLSASYTCYEGHKPPDPAKSEDD